MFGQNEIVGKKHFAEAREQGKILVTTIFATLQGEGPFGGCPAIFVRLAKCNLACSFCDTYFDSGDFFTVEELLAKVEERAVALPQFYQTSLKKPRYNMGVVVTGGEPSLQDNLMDALHRWNYRFEWTQIESNGLLYQNYPPRTVLVVSPKCYEKDGKAVAYFNPNPKVLERADCLKFVISGDPDSPYYTIPQWALDWKKQNNLDIYISPMNEYLTEPRTVREREVKHPMGLEERSIINETVSFWEQGLLDQSANQRNHEWAAKYCMDNNLRLNLQMHLYASLP